MQGQSLNINVEPIMLDMNSIIETHINRSVKAFNIQYITREIMEHEKKISELKSELLRIQSDDYNVNDSENDCILRVSVFLYNIINKYKNTDKNILIVTHMSIVNIILGIHNKKIYYKNFNIDKPYAMGLITELK